VCSQISTGKLLISSCLTILRWKAHKFAGVGSGGMQIGDQLGVSRMTVTRRLAEA
jgi:hypothetical protein